MLVNGHQSEWFQMTVGNRQGDPWSPQGGGDCGEVKFQTAISRKRLSHDRVGSGSNFWLGSGTGTGKHYRVWVRVG